MPANRVRRDRPAKWSRATATREQSIHPRSSLANRPTAARVLAAPSPACAPIAESAVTARSTRESSAMEGHVATPTARTNRTAHRAPMTVSPARPISVMVPAPAVSMLPAMRAPRAGPLRIRATLPKPVPAPAPPVRPIAKNPLEPRAAPPPARVISPRRAMGAAMLVHPMRIVHRATNAAPLPVLATSPKTARAALFRVHQTVSSPMAPFAEPPPVRAIVPKLVLAAVSVVPRTAKIPRPSVVPLLLPVTLRKPAMGLPTVVPPTAKIRPARIAQPHRVCVITIMCATASAMPVPRPTSSPATHPAAAATVATVLPSLALFSAVGASVAMGRWPEASSVMITTL